MRSLARLLYLTRSYILYLFYYISKLFSTLFPQLLLKCIQVSRLPAKVFYALWSLCWVFNQIFVKSPPMCVFAPEIIVILLARACSKQNQTYTHTHTCLLVEIHEILLTGISRLYIIFLSLFCLATFLYEGNRNSKFWLANLCNHRVLINIWLIDEFDSFVLLPLCLLLILLLLFLFQCSRNATVSTWAYLLLSCWGSLFLS